MKTILIIEYTYAEFNSNNYSGTTKCGYTLFNFLNSLVDYNCYYAIYGNNNIQNVMDIDNINYHIKYDLVIINGVPDYDYFIEQKKKFDNVNNFVKYICICHGQLYWEEFLNNYIDKTICVSKYNYDLTNIKNKSIIYNPINSKLFENLTIEDKVIEPSLIISYNSSKGNVEYFLDNIFPLIKKQIVNFKVYIAEPYYIYPNNIKKENYINDDIVFLGYIDFNKLFKLYNKIPVSWDYSGIDETCPYNAMEHLLCYINIVSPMTDGTKYVCNKSYYNNNRLIYKIRNNEDIQIANFIIDRILNYDKYKKDLINAHNYILNNFDISKIMKEYLLQINEILNNEI